MKAIICGDVHIGAVFGLGKTNSTGGNTRIDDYETTLNNIIDYTISSGAEVFIQTGDLFETRNPTPEHIEIADRAIRRLSDNHIFTIIIMGNHDYKKIGHSFTSAITSLPSRNYPNVRLIVEPENIIFTNKNGVKANLFMIPFRDKRMYPGKNQKEIVDSFNEHIKDLYSDINPNLPTCVVGHNFFFKGNYFDFGGSEVFLYPESVKTADIVVMGHFHGFANIKKDSPKCFYSGSMEKTNFGDQDSDKYFIEYDFLKKQEKILKSNVRDLNDITIDLTQQTSTTYLDFAKDEISKFNLENSIVRCRLKIKENISGAINKGEIEKILNESGLFFLSKIIIEVIQTKAVVSSDILQQKTDYDIFSAYAKSFGMTEKMLEDILSESRSIIK